MIITHASINCHVIWKGPKRYIRIIIHENVEEFREYAKRFGTGALDWNEAAGAFHPAPQIFGKVKGEWVEKTDKHYAGTMRLCRGYVSAEEVIHETVHAAAHIWRMDVAETVDLEDNCMEKEENFAYLVGDLGAGVSNALHKVGAWDDVKEA